MRRWTRRRFAVVAAALVVVVPAVAYGVFVLISGSGAPPLHGTLRGGGSIDGTWDAVAAPPTVVGYRVREKLVRVPAPHDAVGRTSAVHGTIEITGRTVRSLTLDADLSTLRSDRSERDRVLRNEGPQFGRFRHARFVLRKASSGAAPAVGDLTLHGVTRRVRVPFSLAARGDVLEAVGSFRIRFADYGFAPPRRPIVTIDRSGTIEFRIRFRRR